MPHLKEFCKFMGAMSFIGVATACSTFASLKFVDKYLFNEKK
jgi:hypothetical protein